jgi:hypothetical protein
MLEQLASFQGRPVWRASDVSRALGYSVPYEVGRLVRGRWARDLIEGIDWLEETERSAQLSQAGRRGVLLFESGLHAVLLLTRKPAGRQLRRWLATEVLPSLHRTRSYQLPAPPTSPATVDVLLQTWWSARCAYDPEAATSCSDILADVHDWCSSENVRAPRPVRAQLLGRWLRRRGVPSWRTRAGRGWRVRLGEPDIPALAAPREPANLILPIFADDACDGT